MPDTRLRCRECHRPLRRPSLSGYGPVCERRRNARPAPTPAARTPTAGPVPQIDGQVELPLIPFQPTLHSL
ncbi:hypothetical protein ADK57_32145 [Streptomyces sp. MMG1533]|uniref:hypothetical protein n=1 Tax=Streptomyces sp. MMG1533 TaxID=1415546 RepID=UPI0006B06D81|nr:hypothetical protein [Streptomyces sp. MMG1533]KOU59917.1 hypothetical protein ADK57_32145 [Streptomyces sp. MMG1533]